LYASAIPVSFILRALNFYAAKLEKNHEHQQACTGYDDATDLFMNSQLFRAADHMNPFKKE
jgi:hypothetical protein